jgi:ribosome recycling factor
MNPNQAVDEAKKKIQIALEHFVGELKKIRTGRAHPSMLDSVMVEIYGTYMPLNQIATVTTADAQLLQISPFDPTSLHAIANAIRNNPTLGLNPTDDGRVIRVPIPALTEERRRDLTKLVAQKQEECMVAIRNIRRDALDAISKLQKHKQIGEDDAKRLGHQVEDTMSKIRNDTEIAAKIKEQEIMTV